MAGGYEERAIILQGLEKFIFSLVCQEATPRQWGEWLRAPLEHAAEKGNYDLVEKLLKAGANGSAGWKDCHGKTLLDAAAVGGDERVLKILLFSGGQPDINLKTTTNKRTALHRAALGGHEAVARLLVLAGADVNALDSDGNSPLFFTSHHGSQRAVNNLLSFGANPNMRSVGGFTPLYAASHVGNEHVVRALLCQGADKNCRVGEEGWTALSIATYNGHVPCMKALLAAGADIATGDVRGNKPLHHSASLNKVSAIGALLEAGADIEARNNFGLTPLHFTASTGSCEAMLELLRHESNVHAKDNSDQQPLHWACRRGKTAAADLLLRWGADETVADNDGRTASDEIPEVPEKGSKEYLRGLERLVMLLHSAAEDRAWRRRGFLVLCREHPDRSRLLVESKNKTGAIGWQQDHPGDGPSRKQAKAGEVVVARANNSGGVAGGTRVAAHDNKTCPAGGRCKGTGFDGVAIWLATVRNENVYRKIVGFL